MLYRDLGSHEGSILLWTLISAFGPRGDGVLAPFPDEMWRAWLRHGPVSVGFLASC